MPDRRAGLYESLITEALRATLSEARDLCLDEPLRAAEAPDRVALHLGRVVRLALADVRDKERVATAVALARTLIGEIDRQLSGADVGAEAPVEDGQVLQAILDRRPDGTPAPIPRPLIPLLDTTLLTNAPGEPRLGSQLLAEIHSADRIDVVMAFIRRSGIAPLLEALRAHCEAGRSLRVLTTTYTGSTEARALEALGDLGAELRVSYDTSTTRLHAKAWLFHRESGFSTAYIGSSNLTHSAQVTGLEWNVRASGARNPDVVDKVRAVFDSYWNSKDFVPYDTVEFAEHRAASQTGPRVFLSPIELRPEPFQERLLEQLALSRKLGHHRNLLAAATGTGKTVMAAVDYARLRETLPRARLLFVAHRMEILEQSHATFRHALRRQDFGEQWVAGQRPARFEHVFASIQSLHANGLEHLSPDHFDVVIVDEFHHAAAETYRNLLEHLRPRELLGLTATPERSDGLPILQWFDQRIAAELRLWDAIDQHRLTPFSYFGVSDALDLRKIPWKRGRGYQIEGPDGLSNLLTADDVWARQVINQVARHVDAPEEMRALGFCVSIAHARHMARVFDAAGIRARAVWSDSSPAERQQALADLAERRINILFSVDLFNEGVDVPSVDTVLLLRPTDSPTLFLQQLGRGLRRSHGKTLCTVLDFVGHHRKEFRFDRRFRALLGGTRRQLREQIEHGFPFLPAGCHMELDRVARERVLANLRESLPSDWPQKVDELRRLQQTHPDPGLGTYLEETGLELEDVYTGARCWSDLREAAGLPVDPRGDQEGVLRRACGRLLHVDDFERLDTFRRLLDHPHPPDYAALAPREQRLLRMLVAQVCDKAVNKETTRDDGVRMLWRHPQVRAELKELFQVLGSRIDHLHAVLPSHPDVPLQIHGRYSRLEILGAFGIGDGAKVSAWQTGVYWAADARADLLAFTLDKTSGQFSPTTRYRDYAISRDLIHWESQSKAHADSEAGKRYRQHQRLGTSVMLFARLRADERAFWFLGPASYVSHEGDRPMAVTWRLTHPLPGDLFASFAAAVA